jgi:Subtilase family
MNATQLPQAVRDGIIRGLTVVGLAGIALIHLLDTSGHFEETPYLGLMYAAPILGCIAIAGSRPHTGPRPVRSRAALALLTVSLATVSSAAVTSHQATAADVLVRLRSDAAGQSSAVLTEAGGTLLAEELDLWKLPARSAARTLRTLEASGSVAFSEREITYVASVASVDVSDPLVPLEWWRSAIGVDGLTSPGPGVPVSLVDSGVDLDHPEFAGRPNLTTLNTQEPQPFGGVHGTSVASVVGAQENGVGIVGVYPDAVIRSWDAATGLGTELTSSAIVNGILQSSQRGRSVINLSLGGLDPDAAIEAAVNLAVARGSLVVAASGNDGEEGSPLNFPAAFPHVLTVAATQPDGSVAPFSSASRFVDLAAPGAQIPVATLDPETGMPTWALADGTSFAAPLVSGAAAWIWTLRPSLDAGQVAQVLRSTATDIGATGRDAASGFGLLNLPAALSLPAPVRDQSEPNDDVDDVTPGREGYHGTPAFTRRARTSNRASGRVDMAEDPRDVFRVWLPEGKTVRARLSADARIALKLVRSTAPSVARSVSRPDLLATSAATSTGTTLAYRNATAARFVFLVVTPATANTTTYTLSVSTR